MISEKEILDNITANEKFKIICRARKIDIDEMASTIWKIIDNSDLEEKKEYATTCQYEDEYGDMYPTYSLNIYYDLLDTKEDWIKTHMDEYEDLSYEECDQMDWYLYVIGDEFTKEQREFIQLALDCEVTSITIKWMP